jgi:hypothetical protein
VSRRHTSFVLGYHGCDKQVGEDALSGKIQLLRSEKAYDWLGAGIYFWEADPIRAMEWAVERVGRGKAEQAFVVGAVINLGDCLDLTQRENIDLVKPAFKTVQKMFRQSGDTLPQNRDMSGHKRGDKLLRFLDCIVLNYFLENVATPGPDQRIFDTVRGLFVEGAPAYPGARFHDKTHTQISVINPDSILGLFRVPDAHLRVAL